MSRIRSHTQITQTWNSSYCTKFIMLQSIKLYKITKIQIFTSITLHSTSKCKICTNQKSHLLSHQKENYILAAQSIKHHIQKQRNNTIEGHTFTFNKKHHPVHHYYPKYTEWKFFTYWQQQKYTEWKFISFTGSNGEIYINHSVSAQK